MSYDKILIDGYRTLRDLYTTHPTKEQWRTQQDFASLPIAGGIYRDWMVGRSTNERNDYTRNLYGIDWGDVKYPWLSGVTNTNPTGRAIGQAMTATAIPAIMKIYGDDRKKYHKSNRSLPGYA